MQIFRGSTVFVLAGGTKTGISFLASGVEQRKQVHVSVESTSIERMKQTIFRHPHLHIQPPSSALHPLHKLPRALALKDGPVRLIQSGPGPRRPTQRWSLGGCNGAVVEVRLRVTVVRRQDTKATTANRSKIRPVPVFLQC